MSGLRWCRLVFLSFACLLACGTAVFAQGSLLDQLNPQGGLGTSPIGNVVTLSAKVLPAQDTHPAKLVVTAIIQPGWHIYSITQAPGATIPSELRVSESDQFRLLGPFVASPEPKRHKEPLFDNAVLEEHENLVTWTAPIALAESIVAADIAGELYFQACAESCLPPQAVAFATKLTQADVAAAASDAPSAEATAAMPAEQPRTAAPADAASEALFVNAESGTTFSAQLSPAIVPPGGTATLTIVAQPGAGWHIYELAESDPGGIGNKPTLIVPGELPGFTWNQPRADKSPMHAEATEPAKVAHYDGAVTWTIEIAVPADVQAGTYELAGQIGYQVCRETNCLRPDSITFAAPLQVGQTAEQPETIAARLTAGPGYRIVADAATQRSGPRPGQSVAVQQGGEVKAASANERRLDVANLAVQHAGAGDSGSLPYYLAIGFLGGLLLNLMPCVLPVIGLKVLSFVEQAGHSRGRILWLNIWYSIGILSVFLVLATLPVVFDGFGWGQQFSSLAFNVTLVAVVFVMALSFLGVWEIPIPGFVGGGKAHELTEQEGVSGALAKGVITTVLATPCLGPFMGSALGFAFAAPAYITYAVFAAIGLGMASPYLLIGAFPSLIRFLPKPGAWMETFKQAMAFVLLGTVVFLLTFVETWALVPTFMLLMGLWAACWWIGRTPLYANLDKKLLAWGQGAAFAAVIGYGAFVWLGDAMASRYAWNLDRSVDEAVARTIAEMELNGATARTAATRSATTREAAGDELPWRPFSMAALQEAADSGQTVLIDFTADWCLTCKTLEAAVLNQADTRELVEQNGIVMLQADMTRYPPEESELLERLAGGRMVPVLAIFPANRPNEPIVLRDTYTKALVHDSLRQAGPSRGAPGASTAMRQ